MVEKTYRTQYGTIHYWVSRASTAKTWLVFLPGLTADHTLFDRQMEAFDGKYNCFVWDAPAHGASRPFELKFSMGDMAEYLHEILKIEGAGKYVLVGQSMGGFVSQVYMEKYPGEAAGFVSIDSCPLKRRYYSWWELALLKRTYWMYMSIPWKLLKKWGISGTTTTPYGRSIMKGIVDSYEKKEYCQLADHGYRLVAEAVEAGLPYDIKCPVLLLCGERDAAGSAKRYNERWTEYDGHELIWLKGAGHNANTDVPDEVNRLIDEFTL